MDPLARHDITDQIDKADITLPTEMNDPIEKSDPADPMLPTDSTEPTEPTDSTEPREPIDRIEPRDHRDQREVCTVECDMNLLLLGDDNPACLIARSSAAGGALLRPDDLRPESTKAESGVKIRSGILPLRP